MLNQLLENWGIAEVRLNISEDIGLNLNKPKDWKKYMWLQEALYDDKVPVTLLDEDERGQIVDCTGWLFYSDEFYNEFIEAIKSEYRIIFES